MTARLLRRVALAVLLAPAASAATPLPPLAQNERVVSELLAAAIGDEIRKNCPTISARMLRVLARAKALEDYARGLGYTDEQIEAFIESDAEKARLEGLRDAYLARNGVTKGDSDSYCRLGYAEIENGTFTGSLLRGE